MNNRSTASTNGAPTIWKRLFIGILGIQAIMELGIGATLLFNFQVALESGFGITYTEELDILGLALGLYLLLLTSLLAISMAWTIKGNQSGVTMGVIIGLFLIVFGVASLMQSGDMQGITVDSSRGLLTLVFAYMAGKELKQ